MAIEEEKKVVDDNVVISKLDQPAEEEEGWIPLSKRKPITNSSKSTDDEEQEGEEEGEEGNDNDEEGNDNDEEIRKEIESLSDDDLNKLVEEALDKDVKTLTQKELIALDEAGYNIDDIKKSSSPSLFLEAATQLGLEVQDAETFNTLKPNKVEDVVKFTEEVSTAKAEAMLSEYFAKSEVLSQMADFIAKGGEEKDFIQALIKEQQLSSITEINDDTPVEQVKARMTELLKKKGLSDSLVSASIEVALENGTLVQEAKALDELDRASSKEERARLLKEQEDKNKKAQEEVIQYWGNVKKTIESGNVAGVNIPKQDQAAFYEWMAKPVGNSNLSQSMLDAQNSPLDVGLAFDYLRFKFKGKNIDFSKLISDTKNTQRVRDSIKKKEKSDKSGKTRKSKAKVGGVNNIKGYSGSLLG